MTHVITIKEDGASCDQRIADFVEAYRAGKSEAFLSFSEFQGRDFSRFWKNSAILRYDAERADFRIIFFGTGLVAKYGRDVTGLCHKDYIEPEIAGAFTDQYRRSLDIGEPVYISGNFGWQGEDYICWDAVALPLSHEDYRDEVVLHVSYIRNPALAARMERGAT